MDDDQIELMGELMAAYKKIGQLEARRLWIECRDPDGMSNDHKRNAKELTSTETAIKKKLKICDVFLTEDQLNTLKMECNSFKKTERELIEANIEIEYRPTNTIYNNGKIEYLPMNYNKKALINMTQREIPEDICIGLSLGWKFLFPFTTHSGNIHEVVSQLDNCIDDAVGESRRLEATLEVKGALLSGKNYQENLTTQWLTFVSKRTKNFFNENDDLLVTRSDKGAHSVIIEVEKYDEAIENMLSNDSYTVINYDPLNSLINSEQKLIKIIRNNYKCKEFIPLLRSYQPNILQLAKFYGLPKIHKPGFKLRPITALNGGPGYTLGKIFNEMLKQIFPRTHYHIKDSYEVKKFLDEVVILPTDVIKSYDVVDMFSNIPIDLAMNIIMDKSDEFLDKFGIGKMILKGISNFLLNESTFFTAIGKTFKQNSGLPMGGCISPTIARLVMDKVMQHLMNSLPNITFIKIFVDDTIAALSPEDADKALSTLNNFHPNMKFTVENENECNSINFLNLQVIRDDDKIITNWYRKVFASGRLVSFYSAHKKSTIIGTAEAFIKTVLTLSDPKFFVLNKTVVIETLRDNCFPDTVIESLMNGVYTLMRPIRNVRKNANKQVVYKIFPHAIKQSPQIKTIINKFKNPDIILADSTKNTKINHITTRKTRIPWQKRSNIILMAKCNCGAKYKVDATKFNENGEIAQKRLSTSILRCYNNTHAYTKFEYVRGLAYGKQTKYLLKYVKFYYGGKLDNIQADLPNYHLIKLLDKAKIPKKVCLPSSRVLPT